MLHAPKKEYFFAMFYEKKESGVLNGRKIAIQPSLPPLLSSNSNQRNFFFDNENENEGNFRWTCVRKLNDLICLVWLYEGSIKRKFHCSCQKLVFSHSCEKFFLYRFELRNFSNFLLFCTHKSKESKTLI